MLPTLNRTAVVLIPREPFLDWVRALLREEGETDWDDEEIVEEPNVYLLPDSESREDSVEDLADLAEDLFEIELLGWTDLVDRWPEKRDWEAFQDWFDFEFLGLVMDATEDELVLEDPDVEEGDPDD